ncbi:uncharacterized protein LOC111921067 [Lactuca sativa]|uniref:uncharacterized protein LOC111921067 n=1 Tax=Lactuca sativa TaxID=4236 RepID=UPI000CD8B372|nr:uncharacterized protein LOC111921067 [Lactuca sativa]
MAIVLRYVDNRGVVKERFIGVMHVKDTSFLTLKVAIDEVFTRNKLSMSQVRGQCYDGQSNMRGAFNGLKALILQDNDSALCVLLCTPTSVSYCGSCKRQDMLRESQREKVQKSIGNSELETGRGLNQESSLVRVGDTRWGSHFKTITSLMNLFPEVVNVFAYVEEEGSTLSNRNQAFGILRYFKTLDFVFYLDLMYEILHLTNVLSKHLKKNDQDILEAASLVGGTIEALKSLRDMGFAKLLSNIFSFCQKHNLNIVEMMDDYVTSRGRKTKLTNQFHFEVHGYGYANHRI